MSYRIHALVRRLSRTHNWAKRHEVQKAFDIYRRAGKQAEWLSEFYEPCRGLDVGRGERYASIEQALDAPEVILAIDYKKAPEKEEKRPPSPAPPPTEPEPVKVEAPVQTPDLLVVLWCIILSMRWPVQPFLCHCIFFLLGSEWSDSSGFCFGWEECFIFGYCSSVQVPW